MRVRQEDLLVSHFAGRALARRGDPPFFLQECHCGQERRVTSPALWAWKPTTEGALPAPAFPGGPSRGLADRIGPAGPVLLLVPGWRCALASPRPPGHPSSASRPALAAFRARPGTAVSRRTSPPARTRQPSTGRTKARATVPGHHSFPHPPQLCRQALPPVRLSVRPSLPRAAPCIPELGPVRDRSLPTLARRAQEAVTPRRLQRLQRPSSRHLVWRRSRGRRHAERLGRREGGRRRRRAREGAEQQSQLSPAATSGAPAQRATGRD